MDLFWFKERVTVNYYLLPLYAHCSTHNLPTPHLMRLLDMATGLIPSLVFFLKHHVINTMPIYAHGVLLEVHAEIIMPI